MKLLNNFYRNMVLPGHLAGGYLATTAILSLVPAELGQSQVVILYIIGILAGEIPDIDLLLFRFESKRKKIKKEDTHRKYITHLPLFWLFISIIIAIIGLILDSTFTLILSLVILAGTFSHFLFDSIDYGIQWLRPLNNKRFSIFKYKDQVENSIPEDQIGTLKYYLDYIKKDYRKQITFYAELLVFSVAIAVFIYKI